MSKVWRRLQRVGKKAAKFKFTTFSHELVINCNSKWQPDKVCLVWTHRGRKYQSKFSKWEPGLTNVYEGKVEWEKSNDQIEFDVTLYKGINDNEFEEKEWVLMVESEESNGKRRLLASGKFNFEKYVSYDPFFQSDITNFVLKPASTKVKSSSISFSMASQFIKDGKATDEDMISIASYMSSASTATNPYLNSNCLYDDHLFSNDQSNTTLKASTTHNSNYSDNNSEIYCEIDENIDSYFNQNEFNNTLNNIAYNFNKSNYSNTLIEKKNTKQQEPIMKQTVNIQNMSLSPSLTKISSLKTLPSSSSKPDINVSIDAKQQTNVTNSQSQESNPFLDPDETVNGNPFAENESNPFGDEEEEEIEDINNPFLDKTTIELDSNRNVMIKNQDNNSIDQNNNNTSKDLLDWCKDIIKCSKLVNQKLFNNLDVNDFSTSWSDGLAFCAIIHHFRPELIKIDQLKENDPKSNLKLAFNATDKESIVRVVDYADLLNRKNLDQLSIMTYLYQIRERYDSQNVFEEKSISKSKTISSFSNQLSFNATDNFKKNMTINPQELKKSTQPENKSLKNSYFNPFDSDDDASITKSEPQSGLIEIKSDGKIVNAFTDIKTSINTSENKVPKEKKPKEIDRMNKYDVSNKKENSSEELIQKAKNLIEKNKVSTQNTDDLKSKAKKIIAESKSHTKRKSSSGSNDDSKGPTVNSEILGNPFEESDELVGNEYINQEIINLRKKQHELDERGYLIEKQLRSILKKNSSEEDKNVSEKDKKLEDKLLKDWFLLINEKNALLHRQQELEILQNEKSLERRYEMLSDQLRNMMKIDDFLKTDEQKRTETILFNELISLVNKRNELVIQMDEENKLLGDEEYINEFIQNKSSFLPKDKQCLIQ